MKKQNSLRRIQAKVERLTNRYLNGVRAIRGKLAAEAHHFPSVVTVVHTGIAAAIARKISSNLSPVQICGIVQDQKEQKR